MILIDEILVSEDLVREQFVCNLQACLGACCIEGDYGAPLEEDEIGIIESILDKIVAFIPDDSRKKIEEDGFFKYNKKEETLETNLMPDGACVFMGREKSGITYCSIEKSYHAGKTDFRKPISCHLYPVRVSHNKSKSFEALNYDQWDICSPACSYGQKLGIKVYQFAKEALVRKYGQAFYDELDAAARHLDGK